MGLLLVLIVLSFWVDFVVVWFSWLVGLYVYCVGSCEYCDVI